MPEASRQQKITRLRGFQDLVGTEARTLTLIEDHARAVAELYNFKEIRLPLLERIDLYERSTGETSDIVQKQMYVVQRHDESQGEGDMILRPEGTPGVVRAYIEQGLDRRDPEQRFFYSGPMFRYERPQKGRYRQFHQFGVEVFGRPDAACDAELIIMIDDLRKQLGLSFETQLNSLGDANCRPKFREALLEFGRSHFNELCEDCRQRLERNPLRLLDCKIDVRLAELAPKSSDYLCDDCRKHFDAVVELISKAGVPHTVNHRLVRGLDYYTRTTFEVVSSGLGAQNTAVAGGRYDGLVSQLGGSSVPGTGFAIGVERLALAVEARRSAGGSQAPRCEPTLQALVAIAALSGPAVEIAFAVAGELRSDNIRVDFLSPERRLRSLLERAEKIGARFAVIIGDDEVSRQKVRLRRVGRPADLNADVVGVREEREVSPGEVAKVLRELATGSVS
jgi:histidyl-tRNA synthetase